MPTHRHAPVPSASNALSIGKYRTKAAGYDQSAQLTMPLRRRTIGLLALQPGETVLDVGSGTGLSYPLLREAVGTEGWVLGFEQSPEMFACADAKVEAAGWRNVWHAIDYAESVRLPRKADAILFNYTHDITQCPQAVANVLRQAKPGARVAMAGMKFFPWWLFPLNAFAWAKNRPYNANLGGMHAPWALVASQCQGFKVWQTQWGMGYIACGIVKG
jgi:arsenite methyltransferase